MAAMASIYAAIGLPGFFWSECVASPTLLFKISI
jgi:hypothetical protein